MASKLSLVARSFLLLEDDPTALGVLFACDDVGPYRFVGLERAYWPAPGDTRYATGQVSLDLDLRPLASLECAPGVISAIGVWPGRIELTLRPQPDPEMADVRMLEIRFDVLPATEERLHAVLQLLFEGTDVTPEPFG